MNNNTLLVLAFICLLLTGQSCDSAGRNQLDGLWVNKDYNFIHIAERGGTIFHKNCLTYDDLVLDEHGFFIFKSIGLGACRQKREITVNGRFVIRGNDSLEVETQDTCAIKHLWEGDKRGYVMLGSNMQQSSRI